MAEVSDLIIDPKLLAEARELGIDVSSAVEASLRERVATRRREIAWQSENRSAIDAWNAEIERNGLWYERLNNS